MIRLVEDLDAIADAYLRSLNLCFPGWGGGSMFDWCFRRAAGAGPPDLFVAEDEGRLIAGSATSYRLCRGPGGALEPVGCMTASWTLRAARGRGLFPQLIEESRYQARRRGCRLLVAFASAGKASRPGLLAAGAREIEGAILTSPGGTGSSAPPVAAEAGEEETVASFAGRSIDDGHWRFSYTPAEWRGQMLERPSPVERRLLSTGAVALIERSGDLDRLLDVSTPSGPEYVDAVERAAESSRSVARRLSTYSLDPLVIARLTALGFTASRTWFYRMPTGDGERVDGQWWFANGDRM